MNRLLRRCRRPIADLLHASLAAAALTAAFLLRFDFGLPPPYGRMLAESLPLMLAAKMAVFRAFSLRELAWRYLGFRDLLRLTASNLSASAMLVVLGRLVIGSAFPRSIYVIDLLACTALIAAAHAAAKLSCDARRKTSGAPPARVAIYGAGAAGAGLLGELRAEPQAAFEPVLFFDDDPLKRGLRILGVKVEGGLEHVPEAVRRRGIDSVLIAMPSAGPQRLTEIVERCRSAGIPVKHVAARPRSLPSGPEPQTLLRQLREVHLEDLLGRSPVELDTARMRAQLQGAAVVVTGAGGSIGSELCRQIAAFEPSALVGFDHSEAALYQLDRELRRLFPGLPFYPEIGSVRDPSRLEALFREYSPVSVYHAAAYKHVPLMEAQLFEAIENNIFGTRNTARAAARAGAREFVLISSDKAVRPVNVMGATKRLAEMVVQSLAVQSVAIKSTAGQPGATHFMAVRFGNVLGSSGSVVPLFREQIAAGGPVTVTHPDMRRFFMTIPEAAQLVLQAATLGGSEAVNGGEIFVLEMGEPVKIVELARKMILLSGLDPGRDIAIRFTGVRAGEKLSEELSAYEENTLPTRHSQIRIYTGPAVPAAELNRGLEALRAAVAAQDAAETVVLLKELIPGYNPSSFLLRRALADQTRSAYA